MEAHKKYIDVQYVVKGEEVIGWALVIHTHHTGHRQFGNMRLGSVADCLAAPADAELAEFRKIKSEETGGPNTQIHVWDWRYFSERLRKEKYEVDAEQLRVYFPYQRVLDGMFAIYQRIFGLKFERVEPPYKWTGDLHRKFSLLNRIGLYLPLPHAIHATHECDRCHTRFRSFRNLTDLFLQAA